MPDLRKIPAAYGLCGGMDSAACDFYLAERTPPSTNKVPRKGTSLHRYLFQRQIDTFGAYGEYLVKLAYWMALPDDTIDGTQKRTHDEFEGIRSRLDDRIPVVLCLVYVGFDETIKMWENHQVLAYQYEEALPNVVRIGIYDPNFPQLDDVHIKCERISVGSRLISRPSPRRVTVYGLRCTQVVRAKDRIVRGFFMMPYEPVVPPARL
jgi:hypothetical protein